MGYTHYWAILGVGDAVWQTAWPRLIQDTQRIVEAAGVAVSRADGNGAYPPTVDAEAGIRLNGADESHESFIFTLQEGFGFCKTAGKPYDLVVVCILLRAYMLAPQNVKVWSDGSWEQDWLEGQHLYKTLWPDETPKCPLAGEE